MMKAVDDKIVFSKYIFELLFHQGSRKRKGSRERDTGFKSGEIDYAYCL